MSVRLAASGQTRTYPASATPSGFDASVDDTRALPFMSLWPSSPSPFPVRRGRRQDRYSKSVFRERVAKKALPLNSRVCQVEKYKRCYTDVRSPPNAGECRSGLAVQQSDTRGIFQNSWIAKFFRY